MVKSELFYSVLKELHNENILNKCVLVGSWCLDFYRHRFGMPAQIPAVATMDVDLLIPKRIKGDADVPAIMKSLGFDIDYDLMSGLMVFIHGDFKLEFLTDAGAKREEAIHSFPRLKINAQELRYMDIPLSYNYTQQYQDIEVRLPEPEAFALHKIIVSMLRRDPAKRDKDRKAVIGLFHFFETNEDCSARLNEIYNELIPSWRKTIDRGLCDAGLFLPSHG